MNQPNDPTPRVRDSALIAASIVAAAFIVSWGMSNSAPRYQLAGASNVVVRMDTDSGELIACGPQNCTRVQPPDRAKTFGPIGIEIGGPTKKLPAPEQPQSNSQ